MFVELIILAMAAWYTTITTTLTQQRGETNSTAYPGHHDNKSVYNKNKIYSSLSLEPYPGRVS
jgi:hypothetical protein